MGYSRIRTVLSIRLSRLKHMGSARTRGLSQYIYIYIQWRRKVPKIGGGGWGGGGGAHRHVIYVPSVKNQFGYMVIY